MTTIIGRGSPELRNRKKEWIEGIAGIILVTGFVLLMVLTI